MKDRQDGNLRSGAPSEQDVQSQVARTPLYSAMQAGRYQRQQMIRDIEKRTSCRLICYVDAGAGLQRDDILGLMEVLHDIPVDSDIDLLIHTGGGDIDVAEKLMRTIRERVGHRTLRVIVPDYAKSAGTLMALAADRIMMSDCSELGPIDPQVLIRDTEGNATATSVNYFLSAYAEHSRKLRDRPDDPVARLMLSQMSPSNLKLVEAARMRAQSLADKHLQRWMLREQVSNFTKISSDLMDENKWQTHGQVIDWNDAEQLGLVINYVPPTSDEWQQYWSLYCLQRLELKSGQRLFESRLASCCF